MVINSHTKTSDDYFACTTLDIFFGYYVTYTKMVSTHAALNALNIPQSVFQNFNFLPKSSYFCDFFVVVVFWLLNLNPSV